MEWNDVRYFLALARLGSVRAAGATLGVSHSTVARRVEALEARLATRLFDRHRDGYVLTEAGRQMLPGAERVESEMAALERSLLGQDERLAGTVALTCCDTFVASLVLTALAPFCEQHPDIDLSINTDSRPFDLAKREADLAVRALVRGGRPPEYLLGKKLVPVTIASYVARAHADRLDPERAHAAPRWLSFAQRPQFELLVAGTSYPDLPVWGGLSSLELMVHAAREGLGLVMLPTYVGDPQPGLQRLQKPDLRHLADLWVLCHPDLRDNVRIRAIRTQVAEALQRHAPLFRGDA